MDIIYLTLSILISAFDKLPLRGNVFIFQAIIS